MRRGRQNFELELFGCKMYYTSAKLTFGGGDNMWGYIKLQGCQKPIRGAKSL